MTNVKSKACTILVGLLLTTSVLAGIPPKPFSFEDGEQFNLPLSKSNFNRIYVEGEKIVQLSLPENTFVVDKSDMNDTQSNEGSVYLKPLYEAPLTVYFTTDKNHHFSITVHADESDGKTMKFVMRNNVQKHFIAPKISDVVLAEDVISTLKQGLLPENFKQEKVPNKSFYVKKDIKVVFEKSYKSSDKTAYICRLENKSTHPITLKTSLFNHKNAEYLELSDETLAPKQIAYLYGLYSND